MAHIDAVKAVVVGAGGFGRELAELIERIGGYHVVGHVDDNPELAGRLMNGRPVLGNLAWLQSQAESYAVGIGLGTPGPRMGVWTQLHECSHVNFPSFIAPTAVVSNHVEVGAGAVICDGVFVSCNVSIGAFSLLNWNSTIGHDATIGQFTTISPGATVSGYATVGQGCDLGANATIIPGKSVGDDTVIGAGACVTTDLPTSCVAVGVPARVIKSR